MFCFVPGRADSQESIEYCQGQIRTNKERDGQTDQDNHQDMIRFTNISINVELSVLLVSSFKYGLVAQSNLSTHP